MNEKLKYSLSKAFTCSLIFSWLVLILLIIFIALSESFNLISIDYFKVTPIILGLFFVPFYVFFTPRRYIEFKDEEFVFNKVSNTIYQDKDDLTIIKYNDIKSIKKRFSSIPCIEEIVLGLRNGKKISFMKFYFNKKDFEKIDNILQGKVEKENKIKNKGNRGDW